jgi:glycosyltransferase involved in cell wall biosynthesis
VPVLACSVGGVPEIVKEESTGWLCEAGDLASLIGGLGRVAEAREDQLRVFGQNAASFIRANHNRKAAHSRAADLIEALSRGSYPRWFRRQAAANQEKSVARWLWERWFSRGKRFLQ